MPVLATMNIAFAVCLENTALAQEVSFRSGSLLLDRPCAAARALRRPALPYFSTEPRRQMLQTQLAGWLGGLPLAGFLWMQLADTVRIFTLCGPCLLTKLAGGLGGLPLAGFSQVQLADMVRSCAQGWKSGRFATVTLFAQLKLCIL